MKHNGRRKLRKASLREQLAESRATIHYLTNHMNNYLESLIIMNFDILEYTLSYQKAIAIDHVIQSPKFKEFEKRYN